MVHLQWTSIYIYIYTYKIYMYIVYVYMYIWTIRMIQTILLHSHAVGMMPWMTRVMHINIYCTALFPCLLSHWWGESAGWCWLCYTHFSLLSDVFIFQLLFALVPCCVICTCCSTCCSTLANIYECVTKSGHKGAFSICHYDTDNIFLQSNDCHDCPFIQHTHLCLQ